MRSLPPPNFDRSSVRPLYGPRIPAETELMKNHLRRPSPALILAIAALVLALTGSAVAANRYLITNTKQISPAVLKQLAKMAATQGAQGPAGSPGTAGAAGKEGVAGATGAAGVDGTAGPAGPEGSAGKEGAAGRDGLSGSSSDLLWAVVEPGGDIVRAGEEGVTANEFHNGTGGASGTTIVRFQHFGDITNCAYEATIGLGSQTATAFPGFATVVRSASNDDGVYVQTFNEEGQAAALGFHLAVIC
jgi:hypothetical protein